jgi:calreticulin
MDAFKDELTHSYTLIIFANRSYEVRLDGTRAIGGYLNTDFELGGSEFIPDPNDLIPDDWDNRKVIPDPNDEKPADWDDRPIIPDPDAVEPPEWRENVHGKWTPPLIQNPDYLGVWKPKMIPNPA